MLKELRFSGYGGQGVMLAAHIVGRAVALYEGGYATMTQSFGPEARGGAASAQLVLSDAPVLYPYVTQPDILVTMSQEAYSRFVPGMRDGGILLTERDLVRLDDIPGNRRVFSIPATRIAEELGKKMVLNVVMVGFLCSVTAAVSREACRKAIADAVPARFRDLNLAAFERGFEYGNQKQAEPHGAEDFVGALIEGAE